MLEIWRSRSNGMITSILLQSWIQEVLDTINIRTLVFAVIMSHKPRNLETLLMDSGFMNRATSATRMNAEVCKQRLYECVSTEEVSDRESSRSHQGYSQPYPTRKQGVRLKISPTALLFSNCSLLCGSGWVRKFHCSSTVTDLTEPTVLLERFQYF